MIDIHGEQNSSDNNNNSNTKMQTKTQLAWVGEDKPANVIDIETKNNHENLHDLVKRHAYAFKDEAELKPGSSLKDFLFNKNYKDINGQWAYKSKKWNKISLITNGLWLGAFIGVSACFFSKTLFTMLVHDQPIVNGVFLSLVSFIALTTPLRIYIRHKADLYKNEKYFNLRITDYFLHNPNKLKAYLSQLLESDGVAPYFKKSENYISLINSLEIGNRKLFHRELHKFLSLYYGASFSNPGVEDFIKTGNIPDNLKNNSKFSWSKLTKYFYPQLNRDDINDENLSNYLNSSNINFDEKKPLNSEIDKLNRDFSMRDLNQSANDEVIDEGENNENIKKIPVSTKYLYAK